MPSEAETAPDAPRSTSAGRLHALVLAMVRQPTNATLQAVWRSVLRLPDGDLVSVFAALVKVSELVRTLRADITLLPRRRAEYLRPFLANIDAVLNHHDLNTQWGALINHFSEPLPSRLEAVHMDLEHEAPEEISRDRLSGLLGRAERLRVELEGTVELPSSLRLAMLDLVERLKRAIREYQLTGNEGLEEVLTHLVGVTRANAAALYQHRDNRIVKLAGGLFSRVEATIRGTKKKSQQRDPALLYTKAQTAIASVGLCLQIIAMSGSSRPSQSTLPAASAPPAVGAPRAIRQLSAGPTPPDATTVNRSDAIP